MTTLKQASHRDRSAAVATDRQSSDFQIVALGWTGEDQSKLGSTPQWLSVVTCWRALRQPQGDVHGRLIVAAELNDPRLVQRLQWLSEGSGAQPLFLATRFEPENLCRLKEVIVDEVVNWEQPAAAWKASLPRGVADSDFRTLAETVRNSGGLDPIARMALIRLALANPPFLTVTALAGSLGYTANGLRYHFSPLLQPWRLKDLVSWFALLRYGWCVRTCDRGSDGSSLGSQGPVERTLADVATRLLGDSRARLGARPAAGSHPMLERILNREAVR
jgi:hypothetical protein